MSERPRAPRSFTGSCAASSRCSLIALLIYPADWLVWKAQTLFGGGMGSVDVSHFTVAELKANKEEYYPDGTQTRRVQPLALSAGRQQRMLVAAPPSAGDRAL